MNFPETTARFVAYFDIMGFKDLIYRNDHSAVSALMARVSANVAVIKKWERKSLRKDAKGRKKDIDKGVVLPVLFSDSVLFVSRSNSVFDARKAAFVSSEFLREMFLAHVPVKGALAYGTFTADFKASKFFGRPLVDAYLLAEETHFYGAVLHHSFEGRLRALNEEFPESLLKRKAVPMKSGLVTHSFIDWRVNLRDSTKLANALMETFYDTVSGSTRRYVDNTKSVYDEDSATKSATELTENSVGNVTALAAHPTDNATPSAASSRS